ncbi:hypothetical protein BCR42DRAFT_448173 [Absidia repens]|uniref:Uncharacterized protein n=1 Tax=Absidia repens TaxID=90262 RepID=A0A1X2IS37_9FUNG|nr:hypothetical protein BCR42DRAFT_448173 [Absidia repens]
MLQRLPILFKSSIKSGIRTGTQERRNTAIRSYATHQEQDAKPSSSSTPLIVAGVLAVGGYVYYSKNKGPSGNKKPDPSDVAGQKFQKEADQEISKRTDARDSVDIRGQSPSTIQNENKELAGHPVATKKDAYVDPSTEEKQTSGSRPSSSSSPSAAVADLKEGAQEQWDKAKQGVDRTVRTVEDTAQDAKDKAQATWNQVSTTASDRADETEQAAIDAKERAKNEWNRLSTDASNKVEEIKDQANTAWSQASTDANKKVDEAKDQAKESYKDAQSRLEATEQKAREKADALKDVFSK